MTAPRATVLMPVLDEAAHLQSTLERVMAQSERDIEILVSDGGSRDGTREIVRAAAAADSRVALLDNPRRIQAAGLNVGLSEARGEIVVRLDARSIVEPDYVERCVKLLETTGAEVVGGRMDPRPDPGPTSAVIGQAMQRRWAAGPAAFHHPGTAGYVDTVYLGAFRKRTLQSVGGWAEDVGVNEDAELNVRIRERGGRIYYDPDLVVGYVPRPTMRTLARQYYRYGRSRVATLLKHPGSLHVRQAAPAMVAPVAVAAAAGPGPLRRLGRVLTLAYLGAITVLAGRDRALRPRERIRLGVAALVMHGAWSAGFWVGLVRRPRRERSPVDVLVVGSSLPPGGIATAIEMQLEAFREAAIGAEMEDLGRALRDRPGAVSAVNVGAVVRDALAVARRVRSTRPQLVALHVTAWPTLPLLRALALAGAARLAGARPIVHLHGDIERGLSGASGGAYRPVMRALGRLASFVVLTPTLAERLGEIAQSVAVVPNGVDTDRFRPAPDPPGAPTVVFVGALGPSKGVDDLLAVADDLPDAARVLVVGSTGPDGAGAARAVEDRAAQLPPGRVELVGLVGHEALPETLRRGSVFVLPSRAEGLSLALLEAMSSGLACVVTDVGESGRVVREAGAGIVVRPGDREGLRNALVHLLEDHELVSRLGRAARTAAVERWSIGAYRDRLAQAYAPELEALR